MPALLRRFVSWVSASALALAPLAASANPLNGQVVGGAASIAGQGTSNVVVDQSTNRAIIDWRSFNIAPNETTQFIQPNASSVILNRVTGSAGASQIDGMIKANGGVYVVNPDGILFGPSANINVGSFLGTTHDIANGDFMAGKNNFTIPGNPSASIVNQGTITAASGGFAALVAPGVRNDGIITANLGTVALASGNAFTLDLYGDNLITLQASDAIAAKVVDVATGQTLKSLVQNTGKLKANGGTVSLTAVAAKQVLDSVINSSGVIEADTVGTKNGLVVFGAATAATKPAGAPTQTVKVAGKIAAAGKKAGATGGRIQISGESIQLAGATLDASGQAGGGTVLIGGVGHSGAGPTIPIASDVTVDAATTIDASANGTGNGGAIVVWSDGLTTFAGAVTARGGAQNGDGGLVETSGGAVDFTGIRVDTSAPFGKTGTWLVDPTDLTVDGAAATTISSNLATTSVTLQTNADGTTSGPGNTSSGPGDIIVAAPISWASARTLTLNAYNAITVNAPITVTGNGGLVLMSAMNPLAPAAPLISFGGGASVQFTGTPNSGQSLAINGQAYTLLYSMSDVQGVNASSASLSGYYALAKPLDATAVSNWTPIGTDGAGNVLNGGNGFDGAFQGLGNTISNLTINLPSSNRVGLYGFVGSGGVLQNFGLVGGSVSGSESVGGLIGSNSGTVTNAYATGTVGGGSLVGGLIGGNGGPLVNVYATGAVNGSWGLGGLIGENGGGSNATLTNSYAVGAVTGGSGSYDVGGLIGLNNTVAPVTNVFATGAVTGGSSVGGLIGQNVGNNNATVTDVFATGAVSGSTYVGGLIGWNIGFASNAVVANAYATGVVTGDSGVGGLFGANGGSVIDSYATGAVSGATQVGGLIGANSYSNGGPTYNGTVTQAYATGVVTGGTDVGGLVGYNGGGSVTQSYWDTTTSGIGAQNGFGDVANAPGVTGLTTAKFGSASNFSGWNFGTTPGGPSCVNGGACWVIVDTDGSLNNNAGGAVGATRPMLLSEYSTNVTNAHQLQLMELDPTASYTLANNINLGPALANPSDVWGPNGGAGFVPIGNFGLAFTGTFNGQGNTISNLAISPPSASVVGLFGVVGAAGMVENVGLLGGGVSGNLYVGDLVGFNSGTVTNAYSTGAVAGTGVDSLVGGLVGESIGTVTNSYATGAVNVNISGANGNTSVDVYAGGLVGYSGGSIANSYATGAVKVGIGGTDSSIDAYAGGLAGYSSGSSIASSHATGAVNLTLAGTNTNSYVDAYAGGLVGYNYGASISSSHATGAVSVTLEGTNTNTSDDYNGDATFAGGLVGSNGGASITNSYASGVVNVSIGGTNTNVYADVYAGGLVGSNGYNLSSGGSISTSYATGAVSVTLAGTNSDTSNTSGYYFGDTAYAGGLVGYNYGGSIANSSATGAVSIVDTNTNTSGYSDGDSAYAGGVVGSNTGASITNSSASGAVSVTLADTNTNTNTSDDYYGGSAYAGGLVGSNAGASITYSSATGAVSVTLAGAYTNTSGYYYSNSAYAGGLVGSNDGSSIANSYATGAVSIGSTNTNTFVDAYAGGLVGSNGSNSSSAGSISSSYATGAVSVTLAGANTNTGDYDYGDTAYAGGLVGYNYGSSIANSSASGVVNVSIGGTNTNAYSDVYAGGLVGSNGCCTSGASITNSSATGTVSVTLANTNTSGDSYYDTAFAGGLVGYNYGSAIANSSATGAVSIGSTNTNTSVDAFAGGLVGYNGYYLSSGASIINSSAAGTVNVTLADTNTSDNYYGGSAYAGGLVGSNYGSSIANSSATGSVTVGANGAAGGLVGFNSPSCCDVNGNPFAGAITNSYATGAVTAGDSGTAGGLVGSNAGAIAQSYATGAVTVGSYAIAGGLVGSNGNCFDCNGIAGTSIMTSYAAGAVSSAGVDVYIGGLVGQNYTLSTITNSHATGNVSATGTLPIQNNCSNDCPYISVGGLVGGNGGAVSGSYATGAVTAVGYDAVTNDSSYTAVGGLVGQNGNGSAGASIANSYATGAVSSAGQDANIGGLVGWNSALSSITNSDATGNVSVTGTPSNQNPCSSNCPYIDVGGLVGSSDGAISGSYASGAVTAVGSNAVAVDSYMAVGGLVGQNGTFSNGNPVAGGSILNSFATGVVSSAGVNVQVGGLVGQNNAFATITNSQATGNVSATGTALGQNVCSGNCPYLNAGGLVGANDGAVTGSYATGAVTAGSIGIIGAYANSGGLVGYNDGTVSQSYATGPVTAGWYANVGGLVGQSANYDSNGNPIAGASIANSYATGAVSSAGMDVDLGGLVGFSNALSPITNSYATGNVSATGTPTNENPCSGNCAFINIGGLVGASNGSVTGSYATGTVTAVGSNVGRGGSYTNAGGLVGYNNGAVSESYATGAVMVGTNASAGGLVGENGINDSNGNPIAGASITNSYATGAVSSSGVDVTIGGLVGGNDPLSLITNSYATGNVSATGTIASQDCSGGGVCDYLNAGGLVGFSYGTISGPSWVTPLSLATAPTSCGAGETCASGTVTVGSRGDAGGLVGFNHGIIANAFAIANVSGAPGLSIPIGSAGWSLTRLGGLAADNMGQITNSFALGAVGSPTTANLGVGGLVAKNYGLISGSFANVTVSAGDNSIAGGLVERNLLADSSSCYQCYTGYSENTTETISNSNAYGNVTVGASSIAGGLVGETDFFAGGIPGSGSIANSNAFGAVTAGGASIVGGLAGAADSTISASSAQNTLVSSTGPNSIVGGLVGFNAGSVTTSSSSAPVSAAANSYVGGLIGINIGSVTQSMVDPPITVGDNSFGGGIAGLNIGSINGDSAQVTITSGSGAIVGGVAGVNGAYANGASPIPNSSFPTGTIANSTASGTGFSSAIGATAPSSWPALPSWLSNCASQLCTTLAGGALQNTSAPGVVTYSIANASFTYGTVATPGAVTLTGAPSGVTATIEILSGATPITLAANTPVGSYTEIVTGLSNPNYTIASSGDTMGTLTINPVTLTYNANLVSRTYAAANPALNGTVTGFVAGDTLASATTGTLGFSTAATPNSNVGSYAINGGGLGASNYVFAQSPANATALTIAPAPVMVTALGGYSAYGSPPVNPGLSATGLQNGQNVGALTGLSNSFGITSASTVAGSPYTVSVLGTLTNPNYFVAGAYSGTWIVGPEQMSMLVSPQTLAVVANPNPIISNTQPKEGGCKTMPDFGFNSTGGGERAQLAADPSWRNILRDVASAVALRESIAAADLEKMRRQAAEGFAGAEEATAEARRIGSTVIAHNEVSELNGAAVKGITVGDEVFADETVKTGQESNGKFVFADETNLAMGPKSTVKLDRFVFSGEKSYSTAAINLTQGAFRFITGNSPKKAYDITTPVASIGVRGTIVDIKVDKSGTTVALVEGNALICPRGNHEGCAPLKPGQTATVSYTKATVGATHWTFASACVGNGALCGQTSVAAAATTIVTAQRLASGSSGGGGPCAP